jgi:predicted nuclease of predicted toxin-antitoxin system
MILADENIHGFIIKTLREAGFEVIAVRQTASGIKDENVIQLALQHNYLLLTEDKDFGEWVFAHHIKDLSVLFLRYSFHEYQEIAQIIVHLLKTQIWERPFFATVTTKKIRIRKL